MPKKRYRPEEIIAKLREADVLIRQGKKVVEVIKAPGAEPKLRYLVKGSVPDHGNDAVSDGHREYDSLDWIARRTSSIPEKGAQLVHYFGAYPNTHRGVGPWETSRSETNINWQYGELVTIMV